MQQVETLQVFFWEKIALREFLEMLLGAGREECCQEKSWEGKVPQPGVPSTGRANPAVLSELAPGRGHLSCFSRESEGFYSHIWISPPRGHSEKLIKINF